MIVSGNTNLQEVLNSLHISCDDVEYGFEGTFAKLSVEVHTSLELVGLTAVLAKALADNEISANVVAAYYHDHVFVQYDLRQKATDVLLRLNR